MRQKNCEIDFFFLFQEFVGVSVEYITMPGWKSSIAGCKVYEDLPANAKKYIETIEQYLNIPGIYEYGLSKSHCYSIRLNL